MKIFSSLFLMIVINISAHAQGLTKYGQITTNVNTYVDKNGRIGGSTGINKNGKEISTIPSVVSSTGKTWMDRNLGATQVATSSTHANSYGDLYQWGRGKDGHQLRGSGTTPSLSTTDVPVNWNCNIKVETFYAASFLFFSISFST